MRTGARCSARWSICSTRRSRLDARYGDLVNVRERVLEQRVGSAAGWLNAGRPRREAGRIAFRIALRSRVLDLAAAVARFAAALTDGVGARAGHADARLHLPAGRSADHRRPLAALVRLSGAARPRPPAATTSLGSTAAPAAPGASTGRASPSTASGSPRCWASAGSSTTPATRTGRPTGSPTSPPTPRSPRSGPAASPRTSSSTAARSSVSSGSATSCAAPAR